eukprot:EC120285.1.p1 GENE.EC120285.1~~EC120285.1.p1  ORF type:complete len:117 (+),score=8.61 EC120285.1:23-373(+)
MARVLFVAEDKVSEVDKDLQNGFVRLRCPEYQACHARQTESLPSTESPVERYPFIGMGKGDRRTKKGQNLQWKLWQDTATKGRQEAFRNPSSRGDGSIISVSIRDLIGESSMLDEG